MSSNSQDEEKIVIESSFKMAELSDNNEVQFTIYQDKRKALTVSIHLDSINAVIKRIISDGLTGKIKYVNFDADPEKGGEIVSEEVVDIQEGLQNSQTQQLFDLWMLDATIYVLKNLLPSLANTLGQLEYEAALEWAKSAESKINEGGYIIDNKVVKISVSGIQLQSPPDKILIEEFTQRDKELLKKRLGVRGRGGSEGWWTEERRSEFLSLYESTLEKVKGKSADLPLNVLEKLKLKGEKPSDVAREYAAELFGVSVSDYLARVLTQARSERKRRTLKHAD